MMPGFDLIIRPDTDDPDAAEVLVEGTLGGRPYTFLLDTGAAMSAVACDDYTSRFEVVSSRESNSAFSRGSQEIVKVPEISLSPIKKINIEMARFPAGVPGRRNLIGMNLLKDHALLFDFKHNRVEVDPTPPVPDAGLRPLTTSTRSHPFVEVDFGGVVAKAVWDTGAGMTVVGADYVQANPDLFRSMGATHGTDSQGSGAETPLLAMKACRIGGARFPAHKVAQIDLTNISQGSGARIDMILGYNIMRRANWYFDFPNKKWAVVR
jgi:hypothetical protein